MIEEIDMQEWTMTNATGDFMHGCRSVVVAVMAGICGLLVLCTGVQAKPAADCGRLAARVAQLASIAPDRRRESNNTFFFRMAKGAKIQVRCPPNKGKAAVIYLGSESEYPPRSFYEVLAKIGASVSGRSVREVNRRAHRCHRVAKRSADGRAQRAIHTVRLECHRSEAGSSFLLKGVALHRT